MSKSTKITIGSSYEINENTVNETYEIQQVQEIKPFKQVYDSNTYLSFMSPTGLPYIYIMDFITNQISDPILATPLYKCFDCDNDSKMYIDYTGDTAKVVCKICKKVIEIKPHIFFDTYISYYDRNGGIETNQIDDKTGLPLNWEFKYKRNITAYTYNDEKRIYNSGTLMKPCNKELLDLYARRAHINKQKLKNREHYKVVIYRNYALPLNKHYGVGLENVNGRWKLINYKDEDQFVLNILPLYKFPDSFVAIDKINEDYIKFMKGEYLQLLGGKF